MIATSSLMPASMRQQAPLRPSPEQFCEDSAALGLSQDYTVELGENTIALTWRVEDITKQRHAMAQVEAVWPFRGRPASIIFAPTRATAILALSRELREALKTMGLLEGLDIRFIRP